MDNPSRFLYSKARRDHYENELEKTDYLPCHPLGRRWTCRTAQRWDGYLQGYESAAFISPGVGIPHCVDNSVSCDGVCLLSCSHIPSRPLRHQKSADLLRHPAGTKFSLASSFLRRWVVLGCVCASHCALGLYLSDHAYIWHHRRYRGKPADSLSALGYIRRLSEFGCCASQLILILIKKLSSLGEDKLRQKRPRTTVGCRPPRTRTHYDTI